MTRPTVFAAVVLAAALSGPLHAASKGSDTTNLTPAFVAQGVHVPGLYVVEVGGIVVIRGRVSDASQAATATTVANSLGYTRVANLIQVEAPIDDAMLQRRVERELMVHRALDGCKLTVTSQDGVVKLQGRVAQELQKDVAVQLVRNVDGVRSVQSDLQRY